MITEPTIIKDLKGNEVQGHVAKCEVCNGDTFHLFVVNGHNHIQCANPICNESYCQGGCEQDCEQVSENAGCDICGVHDRMPDSKICEHCHADAKCNYCGSALMDEKGECQKCGL